MNGEHTPETEEYGISSFVFRARRPFHPQRLNSPVHESLPGVMRAKGFLWLATRHNHVLLLHCRDDVHPGAAGAINFGRRFCPVAERPGHSGLFRQSLEAPWGDRRQEIVFIGMNMNRPVLEGRLETALLTEEEIGWGLSHGLRFNDPFETAFEDIGNVEQAVPHYPPQITILRYRRRVLISYISSARYGVRTFAGLKGTYFCSKASTGSRPPTLSLAAASTRCDWRASFVSVYGVLASSSEEIRAYVNRYNFTPRQIVMRQDMESEIFRACNLPSGLQPTHAWHTIHSSNGRNGSTRHVAPISSAVSFVAGQEPA